jgi:hypothetical protein
MKTILFLCAALAGLALGCEQPKDSQPDDSKKSGSSSGNPITAPVDYLDAVNKGRKLAENTADITSVNQAVSMFQGEKGRNPKDLNELVTEGYLKAVPKDRYGRQLVYDPKTGQVRVDPKPPEPQKQ